MPQTEPGYYNPTPTVRPAQQPAQQQQQQQQDEPKVVKAVSGRPGQPDAVLVEQNGKISAGSSTDFGESVKKQADQYIESHPEEQPADSKAVVKASAPAPVFNTSGTKVKIDIPQGGDFEATRQALLKYPNGTRVQVGESSNDDVFVYNGGLVNSKGQYYTGYGGMTNSMAEAERKENSKDVVAENVPYSQSYKKEMPNLMGSGSSIVEQPAYKGNYNENLVNVGGAQIDPILSQLAIGTSQLSNSFAEGSQKFADWAGPKGSITNQAALLAGWTVSTPANLLQLGVDTLALIEAEKIMQGAAGRQIALNLATNYPAMEKTSLENPGAFYTGIMLGGYLGVSGLGAIKGSSIVAADRVIIENVRPSKSFGEVPVPKPGRTSYTDQFGGIKPQSKPFVREIDLTEVNRLEQTRSWANNNAYKDMATKADNARIQDMITKEGDPIGVITESKGKSFFDDDMGSAQLMEPLQRVKNTGKTVREIVSEAEVERILKSSTVAKTRIGLGYGMVASMTSPKQKIVPVQKSYNYDYQAQEPYYRITPKTGTSSINSFVSGESSKQKNRQSSTTRQTSSTMAAFAFGSASMLAMSTKGFGFSKLKSVGGDNGGSYRKMFGLGMNKQKYGTGDITGLLYGKKKRKTKRR